MGAKGNREVTSEEFNAKLEELEDLDTKATKGPWHHYGGVVTLCSPEDIGAEKLYERIVERPIYPFPTGKNPKSLAFYDLAFIAASRNLIRPMIDRIRELEELLKRRTRIELNGYTVTKFDDQTIFIEKPDGEGMGLRIDEKWWKEHF